MTTRKDFHPSLKARHSLLRIATGAGLAALCCSAAASPTRDQRQAAADAAANGASCSGLAFYWEISNADATTTGSGYVNSGLTKAPTPDKVLQVASAGKWVYGAYVAQVNNGHFDLQNDVSFLNFKAGYDNVNYLDCASNDTVKACFQKNNNDVQNVDEATTYDASGKVTHYGAFYYGSGNMQAHAALHSPLADDNKDKLAQDISTALLTLPSIGYTGPKLAGQMKISADDYATFLRRLLSGSYQLSSALGNYPVCANSATTGTGQNKTFLYCSDATKVDGNPSTPGADQRVDYNPPFTRLPADDQDWHYSLAHWVEPDGSLSSPGAYGFYPWIDATRTWSGLVAREDHTNAINAYQDSIVCGTAIRRAWINPPASP